MIRILEDLYPSPWACFPIIKDLSEEIDDISDSDIFVYWSVPPFEDLPNSLNWYFLNDQVHDATKL